MKILITGGAGFIGSHLTERLVAGGRSVVVLDDFSTGSIDNLKALADNPRFTLVEGSVLDETLVKRLAAECNVIVHLAAAVGVRNILHNPLGAIRTNVDGTEVVLRTAASMGRKVLVASTSEIYGKNDSGALCESADSVIGPSSLSRWSYATAKKLDEFMALAYADSYGLPVIVTRFFNIVGPRQRARYGMVLPNFVRSALSGAPIRVFGNGQQTRNFCYVGDCVSALIGLLGENKAEGDIFNIGGPEEISMLDLAARVKHLTGSESPIVTVPYDQAYPDGGYEDMLRRVPCICKIQRLIGWKPTTGLDAIIGETARYQRCVGANLAQEPAAA